MAEHENRFHIGNLGPGDVALLRDIAEAAAEKAVEKALIAMGLDPREPLAAQRDFLVLRELSLRVQDPETRFDLAWLRLTRLRAQGAVGKALLTAMGMAIVGAAHAIWTGLKVLLQPHG